MEAQTVRRREVFSSFGTCPTHRKERSNNGKTLLAREIEKRFSASVKITVDILPLRVYLTAMTTRQEAQQSIARLRKGIKKAAPELQEDLNKIAASLESLVESAAAGLGRMGGTARAKKLSKKRRSEIARTAVKAREEKRRGSKKSK